MSGILEALLAATTRLAEATEKNNALMEEAAAGREKVLEATQAATTKAAGTRAKKDEAKADTKEAAAKEPAADQPTVDDVKKAIKDYVGATDRKEERTARASKVRGVLAKYSPEGTESPTAETLAADKYDAFIKTTKKWAQDGDLTKPEPDASDDDDLLGDD